MLSNLTHHNMLSWSMSGLVLGLCFSMFTYIFTWSSLTPTCIHIHLATPRCMALSFSFFLCLLSLLWHKTHQCPAAASQQSKYPPFARSVFEPLIPSHSLPGFLLFFSGIFVQALFLCKLVYRLSFVFVVCSLPGLCFMFLALFSGNVSPVLRSWSCISVLYHVLMCTSPSSIETYVFLICLVTLTSSDLSCILVLHFLNPDTCIDEYE